MFEGILKIRRKQSLMKLKINGGGVKKGGLDLRVDVIAKRFD